MLPYRTLDGLQLVLLFRRREGERVARGLGAPGASHAVYVVFRRRWHIEVHDMAERLDIDAARRDVRCH
jgi:hypothetical protein